MSDLTPVTPSEPTPTTSSSELAELKAKVNALDSQAHTLRVTLLVVVVALAMFFWREAGYNGGLAAQLQPQVSQISQYAAHLQKQGYSIPQQIQVLQGAAQRLADYGKTHPDYAQILAKYGIVVGQAAGTNAPARK